MANAASKFREYSMRKKVTLHESFDFNDDEDVDDYDAHDACNSINDYILQILNDCGLTGDFCDTTFDRATNWIKCTSNEHSIKVQLYDFHINNGCVDIYSHDSNLLITYNLINFIKKSPFKIGEFKCIDGNDTIQDGWSVDITGIREMSNVLNNGKNYTLAELFQDHDVKQMLIDSIIDEKFVDSAPDLGTTSNVSSRHSIVMFKSKGVYDKLMEKPQYKKVSDCFTVEYKDTTRAYRDNLPSDISSISRYILVWNGQDFPHFEKVS